MRRALPFLAAAVLTGQSPDAWQQVLQKRMNTLPSAVVETFGLFFPKSMNGQWKAQDEFVRLRMSGDLGFPMLEDDEEKALREHMAWGSEPRWILISPKLDVLGSGSGIPTADQIRGLMAATGWRSRWDQRADFLREHPDSGDAWSDELREQARFAARQAMLGLQIPAELKGRPDEVDTSSFDQDRIPTDPAQDEAHWGPMAKALHGLMEVEGWTEWQALGSATLNLQMGGAKGSGVLKPEIERLRQGAESALRRRPSSGSLWNAWSTAAELGEVVDPEALLASLEPVPGEPWPPRAAAEALGAALTARKDWVGLERLGSRALESALSPQLLAGRDARFEQARAQVWAVLRVRALLHLNRIGDAAAAAATARSHAGRTWEDLANSMRAEGLNWDAESGVEQGKADGKEYKAQVPPQLAEVLDRGPAPPPPAPVLPPPISLAVIGAPAWAADFQRLKTAPALDPWEPGEELVWSSLDAKREQVLKAQRGWGAEPRWVLMRGEELLDSGTELPEARALADHLRVQGLPALEQLNAFLRRHPDHLEARQARLDMLLARMPNQRLEATLLEDAKATLAPFKGSGAWTPMKALWEPAAQRLLPELEARLRSWPEDTDRWLAYADWSNLHPRRPSPEALLPGLPVWKSRLRGGAGPLPNEVGMAVATRLEEQGRWEDLAAWGRVFWEGGFRTQMRADLHSSKRPREVSAAWGELEHRFLLPYRAALQKLDRTAELRSLDDEMREIKGALPASPRPRTKG